MKIDKIQRRLLLALDRNARISLANLARELKISEETARYRLKNLLDQKIVTNCYPVVDVGLLGISVHKLMMKLHRADETQIGSLANYLIAHHTVNWVARFDGRFDLGCTLWIKHLREVSDFIEALRERFHNCIKSIDYAVNVDAEFFPRDYLVHNRRIVRRAAAYSSYQHTPDKFHVDQTDWSVLRLLAANARISSAEISKELNLAPGTVQRRLGILEKKGVVNGYRLAIDHEKISALSYYILLYLNYVSPARMHLLLQHLRSHPNVVYVIKMLGQWHYDLSVEFPDVESYRSFMMELMKKFSDIIRETETLLTWKVMKFGIMPSS